MPALKVITTFCRSVMKNSRVSSRCRRTSACWASVVGGLGQQDDELLAAVAGQHVLRTQVLAHDLGEVHQGVVADLVAEAVVELLEVVDVEQGDGESGAAALGARGLRSGTSPPGRGG